MSIGEAPLQKRRNRFLMRGVRKSFVVVVVVVVFCLSTLLIHLSVQSTYYHQEEDIATAPFLNRTLSRQRQIQTRANGLKATPSVSGKNELSEIMKTASLSSPGQPLRPHPHAGARFANGSWGYVADVTLVRKWMLSRYRQSIKNSSASEEPPLSYLPISQGEEMDVVCNTNPREGSEKKAGWRLLTRKVIVNGSDPLTLNSSSSDRPKLYSKFNSISSRPRSKILCAIYTYEKKHPNVRAVGATWGWRCDGFFAASTKTVNKYSEIGLGAIDLPHEGPEVYENMWMKTRSIWAYIHDNYLEDFDFFFLGGDDVHVIVENLRRVLDSMGGTAREAPLYLGQWVPDVYDGREANDHGYFCGGGPGYVLNKVALRILVRNLLPNCAPRERVSAEDRVIGSCFRDVGILGNSSVDATGAQRFHGMDPNYVSHSKGENGFFKYVYEFWGKLYGFKTGLNLTSTQSISFHLLKTPRSMKRHHAILYKSCPKGTVLGDLLKS